MNIETVIETLGEARVEAAVNADPVLREFIRSKREDFYWRFKPRADNPEEFDEQLSFVRNLDPGVSFCVGGNASGTTSASALKTAEFVLNHQAPPRKRTPFWIISNTYEQVCDVCWQEKLDGEGFMPSTEVEWDDIHWLNKKKGWPFSVPLKPWPNGNRWELQFKSYEQGRKAMQAASIGGFWFSEQFPLSIFVEVLRGTRVYAYPGSRFAEFTPIDPELSMWVEQLMEKPPAGWRFYRCNTERNRENLAAGWYDEFFSLVPEEMRETRQTGGLPTYEGLIYRSFDKLLHTYDGDAFPPGSQHYIGVDWGSSQDHPFAVVWACRDGFGVWWIYDEYWSIDQDEILTDHAVNVRNRSIEWGWKADKDGGLVPDQFHNQAYADPEYPGGINFFNRYGIPTAAARNAVMPGIDKVREMLQVDPYRGAPKLRIHRRCERLIQEMRKYRWRRSKRPGETPSINPKVATAEPLRRDDDLVCAKRYVIYSVEQGLDSGIGSQQMKRRSYVERGIQLATDTGNGANGRRAGNGNGGPGRQGGAGWFTKTK